MLIFSLYCSTTNSLLISFNWHKRKPHEQNKTKQNNHLRPAAMQQGFKCLTEFKKTQVYSKLQIEWRIAKL